MKCIKCGVENNDDAKYCNNCGTDLILEEIDKEEKTKTIIEVLKSKLLGDSILYIKSSIILFAAILIFAFSFGSIANFETYDWNNSSEGYVLSEFEFNQSSIELYETLYKTYTMTSLEIQEEFFEDLDEQSNYLGVNAETGEVVEEVNIYNGIYYQYGSDKESIGFAYLVFEVVLLVIMQIMPLVVITVLLINVLKHKKIGIANNLLLISGIFALGVSKLLLKGSPFEMNTGSGLLTYIWIALITFIVIKLIDIYVNNFVSKPKLLKENTHKLLSYLSSILIGFIILVSLSGSYINGSYEYTSSGNPKGSITLQETNMFIELFDSRDLPDVENAVDYFEYEFDDEDLTKSDKEYVIDVYFWESAFLTTDFNNDGFYGIAAIATSLLAMVLLIMTVVHQGIIIIDNEYKHKKGRMIIQIAQLSITLLLIISGIIMIIKINDSLSEFDSYAFYSIGVGIIVAFLFMILQLLTSIFFFSKTIKN